MTTFWRMQLSRGLFRPFTFLLFGLLVFSGIANANVTVTRATGGGAIASNTVTGCSAAGTWTTLTNPKIAEGNAGEIGLGNIVLSAPTGFEFNTNAVTILLAGSATAGNNINNFATGTSMAVTSITATAITFNVTAISTSKNTLTWQNIQVRPTASTPLASGNITETGPSSIAGINSSTNLGTLTEVASSPACVPPPTVTTNPATVVNATGATLNGTVSSNGASTTVTFDYGTTTGYGSSVTAAQSPLAAGASNSAVSAVVTGLACGTTYHFRVDGANSGGTSNGSDRTFTTLTCPTVTSINTASINPTAPATAVAWTVVFSASVTGVDATDFVLVQGGSVTGATITSVTGSGTTWTVNANTGSGTGTLGLSLVDDDTIINGSGTPLGGVGSGNGNFTGQVYAVSPPFCSPPSNIPVGVTVSCQCDTFARASLQPSTIFNSNWNVSTSDATGILPSIVNPGYLRLTNNTGNNAKAATVPGIFPAAGNYISVEFQQYAYNGTGADGIAMTLSDYSVAAVPGAYGGSLGYAQETGIHDGFAGGWLGVALDEYGNYQSSTEGRLGGACTTSACMPQAVGARGSGAGQTGYRWLGGTSSLSPTIDNRTSTSPSLGYYYQVIVDARSEPTSTAIAVNRDTGSGYAPLISIPNVYTAAIAQGTTQAPVPANWQISFTGSTGGSTNIHEIGGLRICASTMAPPSGGTAGSFNAIDEGYGTPPLAVQKYLSSGGAGHIYTKLVGTPFKLDVAALSGGQLLTTYAFSSNKSVTVNLVDNSDGACILDSTKANYCNSTCTGKTAVTGGTQTLTFAKADQGQKQSPSPGFTINSAYKNLVAIISDGTTTACSTDAFSVRPTALTLATNATTTTSVDIPVFKAGTDTFTLIVSATSTAYTGTPTIGSIDTSQMGVGFVAGTLSVGPTLAAAVSGVSTNNSTYSEVGLFKLDGYGAGYDTSARGVFDATWTAVDLVGATADCVAGSYSNVKDVNGKYGCNFGLVADATFGRFIPDHFGITGSVLTRSDLQTTEAQALPFTYMGEPMKLALTVTAYNKSEAPMQNYKGSFAKLDATTLGSADLSKWSCTSGAQCMGLAANFGATSLTSRLAIDTTSTNSALPINTTTAGGVTSGWSGGTSYFTLYSTFARAAAPDGAYGDGSTTFLKIGGKPLDSDGVTIPPRNLTPTVTNQLDCVNLDVTSGAEDATCNPGPTEVNLRRKLFNTTLRYGRLQLQNMYGSERLPLVIPLQAQYWNGGYFVNNADDSLTLLPGVPPASQTLATGAVPAGVPGLYFYPITTRNLLLSSDVAPTLCTTTGAPSGALCGTVGVATSKLAGGQAKLQFLAPASNHPGWLDIILPVPGYLLYNWGNCDGQTGAAGLNNDYSCARATFGIYKSPLIYRRENY